MTNLSQILFELAKWKKEGAEFPNSYNMLESLSKEMAPNGMPLYYIHYSDINKLGINPQSSYGTPTGIYGYPLTNKILDEIKTQSIPFASERPYIQVFKPKNPELILYFQSYTERQLNQDLLKLGEIKQEGNDLVISDFAAKSFTNSPNRTPGGKLWNIIKLLANGKPIGRRSILVNKLGYQGAVDLGNSIIHINEPSQGVFFSKEFIEHYATLDNVFNKWDYTKMPELLQQIKDLAKQDRIGDTRELVAYAILTDKLLSTKVAATFLKLVQNKPKYFEDFIVPARIIDNNLIKNIDFSLALLLGIYESKFINCKFHDTKFDSTGKSIYTTEFAECDINSKFTNISFNNTKFINCNLNGSKFSNCVFDEKCEFINCDLSKINFLKTKFFNFNTIIPGWAVNQKTGVLRKTI